MPHRAEQATLAERHKEELHNARNETGGLYSLISALVLFAVAQYRWLPIFGELRGPSGAVLIWIGIVCEIALFILSWLISCVLLALSLNTSVIRRASEKRASKARMAQMDDELQSLLHSEEKRYGDNTR